MRFGTFYFFQAAPGLSPCRGRPPRARADGVDGGARVRRDLAHRAPLHRLRPRGGPGEPRRHGRARTRRVRIGLAAAILPFHHPLRLAEQLSLIDIISRAGSTWGSAAATAPRSSGATTCRSRRTASASTRPRTSPQGVDRGALRARGPLLHHPRGARHPEALAAAAPADLPGVRQRRRHRELGRARLADAELDPHRPRRQLVKRRDSYLAALRSTGAPRRRSPRS